MAPVPVSVPSISHCLLKLPKLPMVLGVIGQMQVPGEKYQSWEGMNPSRASLCYTNTRKMLIQLSLFYTLLITTAFVNICLMVLYLCGGFGSSSDKHFCWSCL